MAEDAKDLSAQEQEAENAWRYLDVIWNRGKEADEAS